MMKRSNTALVLGILTLALAVLACEGVEMPTFGTAPAELTNPIAYSGDGFGGASVTYMWTGTPIHCSNGVEEKFSMYIAPNSKVPSDSYITVDTPTNAQYFRLTVLWVHIPLAGNPLACSNEFDLSNERIETRFEGFYQPVTHELTILAAGAPAAKSSVDTAQTIFLATPKGSAGPQGGEVLEIRVLITMFENQDKTDFDTFNATLSLKSQP